MKWEKAALLDAIQKKDPRIRNFFDTFGFVVIKGMLNRGEFKDLLKEYDRQYSLRALSNEPTILYMILNRLGFRGPHRWGFREIRDKFLNRLGNKNMRFLPNFIDSSYVFTDFFFREELTKIYQYFAGEEFLYLGSDGSHFLTTSFPWHRDWFTRIPILKFNFYFNPLPFLGGKFMIIPGSHFPDDSYSRHLQSAMAWPQQNSRPGGLAENDFLPVTENPRREIIGTYWTRFKNWIGRSIGEPTIPHIEIKVAKGDLIIFDHRAIHCVQSNFPQFSRRLLTILLSKNAFEFSENHYLLKARYSREDLMREIVDLVVSERNHIDCSDYGDPIKAHEFSKSNHFIKIEKVNMDGPGNDLRYNAGSFSYGTNNKFTSQLDIQKYANIGKEYRSRNVDVRKSDEDVLAQDYGYNDTHLGINAQSIREISNT